MEMNWMAHVLAGNDAEGFVVNHVASSEDLVQHVPQCDLLVTLPVQGGEIKLEGFREDVGVSEAYQPGSYLVNTIGESLHCMLIMPSNGCCGSGHTIFASTCVSMLYNTHICNKWGIMSRQ